MLYQKNYYYFPQEYIKPEMTFSEQANCIKTRAVINLRSKIPVQIADNNKDNAVSKVAQHVALADFVFRSTDLLGMDALPDNIGFSISDITIYEGLQADTHFKDLIPGEVSQLLHRFSKCDFTEYCMAVGFTNRNFGQLYTLLSILLS